MTEHLANEKADWIKTHALSAGGLIALNKNQGARPVGIGEAIRRLIWKVMISVTGEDAAIEAVNK